MNRKISRAGIASSVTIASSFMTRTIRSVRMVLIVSNFPKTFERVKRTRMKMGGWRRFQKAT